MKFQVCAMCEQDVSITCSKMSAAVHVWNNMEVLQSKTVIWQKKYDTSFNSGSSFQFRFQRLKFQLEVPLLLMFNDFEFR